MNLVLLGMPGAGKGTQGKLLNELFSIPHISTGDIFREAMRDDTDLGKTAKSYINKGELVPDTVVTGMVRERLGKDDCIRGFILDGFPRTVAQAEDLDTMLTDCDKDITSVLEFKLTEQEAVRRLSARRSCKACGAVYNIINKPPKSEGICDSCKGELYQRDDDREEVILNRLKVYENQTAPLIQYYSSKGNLKVIDANAPIEEIKEVLYDLLKDKVVL